MESSLLIWHLLHNVKSGVASDVDDFNEMQQSLILISLVDISSEKFKPQQLSSKHASGHFRLPLESGFFMTRGVHSSHSVSEINTLLLAALSPYVQLARF